VVLKCQQCEKQFTTTLKRKAEGHRFCGRACMRKALQPTSRNCIECGKQFRRSPKGLNGKKDKALFCSKPCYFAARNAGRVLWDRSAIAKGSWHRGGRYASAPSMKWALKAKSVMHRWLQRGAGLWDALAKTNWCEVCGEVCKPGSSRFCSYECATEWRGDRVCDSCGGIAHDLSVYSRARCVKCRSAAKKQANKRAKKKYGRNHRQRARHHGVTYVSVPVAAIYERDGYRCQLCGKRCFKVAKYSKSDGRIHPRSPTIDHIVAMACGGNHEPGNLQTACFECNSRKGARSVGQLRMEFA
jgi:5-methylcytosine-specific restriction endonuclease McrA